MSNTKPNTKETLEAIYGAELVDHKLKRIQAIEQHPAIDAQDFSLARAPGRISFSKHCDYVNNDLMYFADDRDTFVAISSKTGNGKISFYNLDQNYPSFISQNLSENVEKNSWLSYPLTLLKILRTKYSLSLDQLDSSIVVSSEIPAAGGLSSSHALLLALIIAIANQFKQEELLELIAKKDIAILKLLQEVEIARGFNSGLGDPAAQLLAKKDHFVLVRLEPFSHSYLKLPDELAIITAPSFIHADKSLPEFAEANANIAAYKTLNKLSQELFGTKHIGDALYSNDETQIKNTINRITDPRLRGLAIYALSEGARLKILKETAQTISPEDLLINLGKHLNLSHQGESIGAREENIIQTLALCQHHGHYGASTKANDQLQALALSLDGVYGSSISGAGLGGNNIILTIKDKARIIKQKLIQDYYQARGLAQQAEAQVHISSSASAACIL